MTQFEIVSVLSRGQNAFSEWVYRGALPEDLLTAFSLATPEQRGWMPWYLRNEDWTDPVLTAVVQHCLQDQDLAGLVAAVRSPHSRGDIPTRVLRAALAAPFSDEAKLHLCAAYIRETGSLPVDLEDMVWPILRAGAVTAAAVSEVVYEVADALAGGSVRLADNDVIVLGRLAITGADAADRITTFLGGQQCTPAAVLALAPEVAVLKTDLRRDWYQHVMERPALIVDQRVRALLLEQRDDGICAKLLENTLTDPMEIATAIGAMTGDLARSMPPDMSRALSPYHLLLDFAPRLRGQPIEVFAPLFTSQVDDVRQWAMRQLATASPSADPGATLPQSTDDAGARERFRAIR